MARHASACVAERLNLCGGSGTLHEAPSTSTRRIMGRAK